MESSGLATNKMQAGRGSIWKKLCAAFFQFEAFISLCQHAVQWKVLLTLLHPWPWICKFNGLSYIYSVLGKVLSGFNPEWITQQPKAHQTVFICYFCKSKAPGNYFSIGERAQCRKVVENVQYLEMLYALCYFGLVQSYLVAPNFITWCFNLSPRTCRQKQNCVV